MTTYHFKAQALTPIHVGSGCEIDPTEFLIKGEKLVQFNVSRIIEDLSPEEKYRFVSFIDRADLKEIQNFLRHHMDVNRHGLSSVDAAYDFRTEYETKASNPNNQFKVDMMPRNPHTGQVFIPGSSIKGAIRTAIVNWFANEKPETRPNVYDGVAREHNAGKKGTVLEERALNCSKRDTHKDIFRLLHVRDAVLPAQSTRIDRAVNSGAKGIQMWVERLKSMADFVTTPEFTVSIRLDRAAMKLPEVKNTMGRVLSINTILEACNRFYWGRMIAEGDRFDDRKTQGLSWQTIEKTFPQGRLENGDVVTINPSVSFWNDPELVSRRMLLRIGHFSHFESLSVNELREGYNVKKKTPIIDMGSTRTRCKMEKGKFPMPFGWLMLTLDEERDVDENY